jgi:tRNA(Ile)-lysidine synthase
MADITITKSFHSEFVISRGNEYLCALWPQISEQNQGQSVKDGINEIAEGWQISCRRVIEMSETPAEKTICYIDGRKLNGAILDTFKPGDIFSPFGLAGKSMKLGDYWTNQALPEPARRRWPLVRGKNGEILWVVGMEISYQARVSVETDFVQKLTLARSSL